MSEINTVFESGSSSLTEDSNYVKSLNNKSYRDFISNSIYLRERHNLALDEYFESLKNLWLEETKWSSNVFQTTQHPAHINIIKLGNQVIPFLLHDLKENQNHWFIALNKITGANPIKEEHKGNVRLMVEDWLKWGEENNMI